jgi:hypothetical protein
MTDTWISDGTSSYLLKTGVGVQMLAGITHRSASTWGPYAKDFDATHFLKPELKTEKELQNYKI